MRFLPHILSVLAALLVAGPTVAQTSSKKKVIRSYSGKKPATPAKKKPVRGRVFKPSPIIPPKSKTSPSTVKTPAKQTKTPYSHPKAVVRARPKPFYQESSIAAYYGVVQGWDELWGLDRSYVYGLDYQWNVWRGLFIPVGLSNWEGDHAEIRGLKYNVLTVDSGVGYKVGLGRYVAIPVGIRLGYASVSRQHDTEGSDVRAYRDETLRGGNIAPFAGLLVSPNPFISFGFEARMVAPYVQEPEERTSDEQAEDGPIPHYQLFTLTFSI